MKTRRKPKGVHREAEEVTVRIEMLLHAGAAEFVDPRGNDSEPQGYVTPISAVLYVGDAEAGRLAGVLVRGDLVINDGKALFDVMDDVSQELSDLCSDLILPDSNEYRDEVGADLMNHQILNLEHLVIEAAFRGHDLGLLLIQHVLRYCPHDLAVLTAFPLQHVVEREGHRTDKYPEFDLVPLKKATAKLQSHYARLGFKKLRGAQRMVRDNQRFYDWLPLAVHPELIAPPRRKSKLQSPLR